jgi:hypothetical protein
LDLPVCRTRQIVAAITQRIDTVEKNKRAYIVWQTKQLATTILNTTPDVEQDFHDKMLSHIREMAIVPSDLDTADLIISSEEFDPEDDEAAINRALNGRQTRPAEWLMAGLTPPKEE